MNLTDSNQKRYSLTIIGGGPRGLSALESILDQYSKNDTSIPLNILLFESRTYLGAGFVYDLEQPDTNWLNISNRGLTIPSRNEIHLRGLTIPAFKSYQDWASYDKKSDAGTTPDTFVPRSTLGKYLNERYDTIAKVLKQCDWFHIIGESVKQVDWEQDTFNIGTDSGAIYHSNEVVLTIGHQPTEHSEQILKWSEFDDQNDSVHLITQPYPISSILSSKVLQQDTNVAIRGFGLAMIDVMRALTIKMGGRFETLDESTQQLRYIKSGNEPKLMVPFSLDGLPMAPKLVNLDIDKRFMPTKVEKEDFENHLETIAQSGATKDITFVVNAIVPIIIRLYNDLGSRAYNHNLDDDTLRNVISSWLLDEEFEHDLIVPKGQPAENTLRAFVGMATDESSVSLDFCIGHVWRHSQPTMYKALSFSKLPDEVISEIVQLDERLKRYSYGPPVASLQQLIALLEVGLISLDYVNNPNVVTTSKGWRLEKNEKSIQAKLMINSVLDAPKLLKINSPVVRHLLSQSIVHPVHSELGIETYKDGRVVVEDHNEVVPLAVLGRIAKGTLIGVDAILECFNERSELWAKGVLKRLSSQQSKEKNSMLSS